MKALWFGVVWVLGDTENDGKIITIFCLGRLLSEKFSPKLEFITNFGILFNVSRKKSRKKIFAKVFLAF